MRSLAVVLIVAFAVGIAAAQEQPSKQWPNRIEDWKDKTIVVFAPHPDDDTFYCGGTLAKLAKNGNKVIIAIYTNDNKGSYDLEMTSERLARIRKAEEEAACAAVGIPKENIIWLGYDDGELEYAPPKKLCGEATRIIRQYRPYAVFSLDPGPVYERWHKSDHRMGAFNTVDAVRAAPFPLYYPEHLLTEGLQPHEVTECVFFDAADGDVNYWVDIEDVKDQKMEAASKHVSQFPPAINKYQPEWPPGVLDGIAAMFDRWQPKKDGRFVEPFRRAVREY
ncbi:MAG: PIG-L family deacetylase [Armatimonadota bacterium]|nr:MAG: PIG-L family deacetylase [Armatimonadota bacterium]